MTHINVGIIGDEAIELASKLAKKTHSFDITYFDTVYQGDIYSFIVPTSYPEKIASLIQTLEFVDIVIFCVKKYDLDFSFGEILLALSFLSKPILLYVPDEWVNVKVSKISKNISLKYIGTVKDENEIREEIAKWSNERNYSEESKICIIDQFFNVRGLGAVVLGIMQSGIIKNHDKLTAYPSEKFSEEIYVKSMQIHDKDAKESEPFCRVGFAIKGAPIDYFERGIVLSDKRMEEFQEGELLFSKNPFYKKDIPDGFQITVSSYGLLRTGSIKIKGENAYVTLQKPIILRNPLLVFRTDVSDQLRLLGILLQKE